MNSKLICDEVPVINIGSPIDERMQRLSDVFKEEFGRFPLFFVKVPGRVNIIGEHIDYCGYPVLPMALKQDILIAAAITDDLKLQLRNVNKNYSKYDCVIKNFEEIKIDADGNGKPVWQNYVLCGVKGALEFLKNKYEHGLQLYIDGNIPPASGLSSSSALVSASCLAFLYSQNAYLSKKEIASLCAESERYIGTQGGGMDQAIAFLAEKYSAQHITFDPLHATPVTLPEDAAFVVAHSLAEANKAATNDFNRRVIECRLAAQVIAIREGFNTNKKIITLSQLQRNLNKTLDEMIIIVHKHLSQNSYSKNDICNILHLSEEEVDLAFLATNTKNIQEFKLNQRALHVYEEAMRVERFRQICANSNKNTHILSDLGILISGSHESLKQLYECSHDNLDLIVDISKEIGVCARVTGAGWGGSIVALCHRNDVVKYIEVLTDKFYIEHCKLDKEHVSAYLFATIPNDGATVYKCLNEKRL